MGEVPDVGPSVGRQYDHQRLHVYKAALRFLQWRRCALRRVPRNSGLADQLTRAAASITLNIAEAAGEESGPERKRFFRMARRSATECDAILESAAALGLEDADRAAEGRALLRPVLAMLAALTRSEA